MKYIKLSMFFVIAGLAACQAAAPQAVQQTTGNIFAIKDITIVDVEKGSTLPGQTVIVMAGRIDQIGDSPTQQIPQGATVVNGEGLYLMPGLTDAHAHYFDAPVFGRLMIANGVLLVRDTGMPNEYILPLRDQINIGETFGPELVTTGSVLDGDPPILAQMSIITRTPQEGRQAVRQQAEAGVDMIKAYTRLDKDVFFAIVDEAHKQGVKVVTHLPETVYLEDAVSEGVDSVEHYMGFEKVIANLLGEPVNLTFRGLGPDTDYLARLDEVDPQKLQAVYERIHASGTTFCPTVVTFKTFTNIKAYFEGSFTGDQFISQSVKDLWKTIWTSQDPLPGFVWQNWVRIVKGLNQNGVPLMIGTDLVLPGILPGYSVHEEMLIWQEAGIPTADILRSATIVPAEFMGLGDRLGSVRLGKEASFVLLRANPLEDIQNAQQIEAVFLRGQYYNRSALDQLLREAEELAQKPPAP